MLLGSRSVVDLHDNFFRPVCWLWRSHPDLEHFLRELGPEEDQLVEFKEENNCVTVRQLNLFVLDGRIHDILKCPDYRG